MRRNRAHCSVVWKEGVVGWVDVFDVDLSPLPSVCGGGRGGEGEAMEGLDRHHHVIISDNLLQLLDPISPRLHVA